MNLNLLFVFPTTTVPLFFCTMAKLGSQRDKKKVTEVTKQVDMPLQDRAVRCRDDEAVLRFLFSFSL